MKNPYLLYVEDDEIEVIKFIHTLEPYFGNEHIKIANNGKKGWEFLSENALNPPKLIVLDINMPEMNGLELLEKIKGDARLRKIPVIMLTTSDNEKDIMVSYQNQVAGYFVKPFDPEKYTEIISIINSYWETSKTLS